MSGARIHRYEVSLVWTGNHGTGTSGYRDYGREHTIGHALKPDIPGSSDPAFRGDPACWNPEQLLLASLAACHQLWYLHLAAEAGLVVVDYRDSPIGLMTEQADGSGRFERVELRPQVTLAPDSDDDLATQVHLAAHEKCFIARSVNFPVTCVPSVSFDHRSAP